MGSCTLQLQLANQLVIQTFTNLDEEPTMILDPFLAIYRIILCRVLWEYELCSCKTLQKFSPDPCILEYPMPHQNLHVLAADM